MNNFKLDFFYSLGSTTVVSLSLNTTRYIILKCRIRFLQYYTNHLRAKCIKDFYNVNEKFLSGTQMFLL